jgi:ABC-2 type transport system permease protein
LILSRSFIIFLRRNWAAARLAVLNQLEYRFNFAIDALVQPTLVTLVEVTLWSAILYGIGSDSLGGFGRESYIAYALWANFVGRVTINWMYEWQMMEDIDQGRINSLLVRPISFYEFYLSQFIGYKLLVAISFIIPVGMSFLLDAPLHLERAPWVALMIVYYLVFVHTLSFLIACLAFYMTRAYSFIGIKNMALWVLSGELIPLDLYPESLRQVLLWLPFASGVYLPVGYLTGRVPFEVFAQGFVSISFGILIVGFCLARRAASLCGDGRVKRHLRIWFSFLRMSAMADSEYRLNVVVKVFGEVVWYMTQLSVFEVLYLHTPQISGWDVHEMRVFMGTLFLVDLFFMILFSENIESFHGLVRKGDLDLYLVKPISAQFMVSCRKVSLVYIPNLLIVVGYLGWALSGLTRAWSAWDVVVYGLFVVSGLMVYYALRFMFACLTLWLQDMGNVQFVWHQLFRLGTRPDGIYPAPLRLFIMSVFPIAFLASVPARALVEGPSWTLLLASWSLGLGLCLLSTIVWRRGLRSYSSASS